MKDIKQLVLENFNVIYYDTYQLNFKCSVKLKTNPDEMTLKLKYKDLKMFSNKNQNFANTKDNTNTYIAADDGDDICLVTLNDISSIKCSRDGLMLADMLENISQEINKAIKMCLWADNKNKNEGYDRLIELIE